MRETTTKRRKKKDLRNDKISVGASQIRPYIVSGDSQFPQGYPHSGLDIFIQMARSNNHLWLHEPDIKHTKPVYDH